MKSRPEKEQIVSNQMLPCKVGALRTAVEDRKVV